MTLDDETFDHLVYKIQIEKQLDLACFQPKFLLEQVSASCKFMEEPPSVNRRYLDYAIDYLRVKSSVQKSAEAAGMSLEERLAGGSRR